jgi:acyl carrier protein
MEQTTGPDFYHSLKSQGIGLGEECQWIDSVWRGEGEALSRIKTRVDDGEKRVSSSIDGWELPCEHSGIATTPAAHEGCILPLGLIDSCFQLISLLVPTHVPRDFLLSDLEHFDYMPCPEEPLLWCHATLAQYDEVSQSLIANLTLLADSGRVVGTAVGARLRRASPEALQEQADAASGGRRSCTTPQAVFDLEAFALLDPTAQENAVRRYFLQELATTTGIPVSRLDGDVPLIDQIDSLMAVELKTRIELTLKTEVPISALFNGQSTNELATLAVEALRNEVSPTASLTVEDVNPVREILEKMERLSEDEARTMLKEPQSAKGDRVA